MRKAPFEASFSFPQSGKLFGEAPCAAVGHPGQRVLFSKMTLTVKRRAGSRVSGDQNESFPSACGRGCFIVRYRTANSETDVAEGCTDNKYNVIDVYEEAEKMLLMCKRTKEPYKGMLNFAGGKVEPGEAEEI